MNIKEKLDAIRSTLPANVTLVAVSKTKPLSDLMQAYNSGQRIFGENKIQEMAEKYELMPKDVEWHMIGHVQSNKVKFMAPFVNLIHGVDSFNLLAEIDKQGKINNRIINCLLQMNIAQEETKFGFDEKAIFELLESAAFKKMNFVEVIGLMGMATYTENQQQLEKEFKFLKAVFDKTVDLGRHFSTLSMGMSGDYKIAIECGSTMIRIGSSIFGTRN